MIAYHGSNSNFRKLRIAKELVKHESIYDNEGLGIYFSTDKNVCKSYGRWLYTLNINDKALLDFRDINTCINYIRSTMLYISVQTGVDVEKYVDCKNIIERIHYGGQAISRIGEEILNYVINSEKFNIDVRESKRYRFISLLRKIDKDCPKAYMFNYNIPNCGVIKDVGENVVQIIKKEPMY